MAPEVISVPFRRYYAVVYALFPFALVTGITGMDVCMILLFLGWTAELVVHGRDRACPREVAWMVGLFLAMLLVPELIRFSWTGLEELVVHHYRKVFLVLIIVGSIRSIDMLDRVTFTWVVAGGLAGLLTVLAYGTEWPVLGRFVRGSGGPHSPLLGTGPGGWKSIQFGSVMAFIFPFGFFGTYRRFTEGKRWKGFVMLVFSLGLLAGIVVSFAVAPLVGTALIFLGSGIGVLAKAPRRLPGVEADWFFVVGGSIVLVGLLLAALLWLVWPTLVGQARPLFVDPLDQPGLQQRLNLWGEVLRQVVSEPSTMLVGSGSGRGMQAFYYQSNRPLVLVHGETGLFRKHAHNNLIQYLLDYGLFGVIAYLFFWGYVLWEVISWPPGDRYWTYRCGGLALIVVVNLCGLTEYNWGRSLTHYNIAFGIGLVLAARWRGTFGVGRRPAAGPSRKQSGRS